MERHIFLSILSDFWDHGCHLLRVQIWVVIS